MTSKNSNYIISLPIILKKRKGLSILGLWIFSFGLILLLISILFYESHFMQMIFFCTLVLGMILTSMKGYRVKGCISFFEDTIIVKSISNINILIVEIKNIEFIINEFESISAPNGFSFIDSHGKDDYNYNFIEIATNTQKYKFEILISTSDKNKLNELFSVLKVILDDRLIVYRRGKLINKL